MNKEYKTLEIKISQFNNGVDIVTLSGKAEDDETLYPMPDGWGWVE